MVESAIRRACSHGQLLEGSMQARMSEALGHNLSGVGSVPRVSKSDLVMLSRMCVDREYHTDKSHRYALLCD